MFKVEHIHESRPEEDIVICTDDQLNSYLQLYSHTNHN